MAKTRDAGDEQGKVSTYAKQLQALNEMRDVYNEAARASGHFHTQTVQTISASEAFTKAISKQKVSLAEAGKAFAEYRSQGGVTGKSVLAEAIREQQALRSAMTTQWTGQAFGKNKTDVFIPKSIGPDLDNINAKYGMMNRLLYSAAQNTVNWGKNTQWAGRQVMVGLTVPLGIAAIGAAAFAKKVDEGLTEVAKVYDTTADTAQGREMELAQVRETGLKQATRLAKEYGMAMEDTIQIQGSLAATGLSGNELFTATSETSRFATLGGIDTQVATDAMVSLKTAFRDTLPDAKSLTDTLNYFNAVENATSLQTKDIADALPRVASSMAATGVNAKQLTVLLVAMRESGVDATIAANALKSGAATILDPTKEAVAYWDETLNKDLPAIVKKAGGNMFEFLKEVSTELHGLDPQIVQTAITKTFGKYQFDRMTSLIGNLGDAMTGTANQTAKSFDLLGASSEELAETSARELENLQKSVSFRFTAAVNSLKAQLLPLGELALEVGTFLIDKLFEPILGFFNGLPKGMKVVGLSILGFMAIVGPLLMITGIMANLTGSVMKFVLQLGNLKTRFKATSVEEAAAAINAKTAASAFNTEGAAAANLAIKIGILAQAMEKAAVARGEMMAADGTIMNTGLDGALSGGKRKVVKRDNGEYFYEGGSTYAPGTKNKKGEDISGNPAGGHGARPEDVERIREIETRTGNIADNSEKTARNFGVASKAAQGLGAVAFAVSMIDTGSESINHTWLNIAMTVGTIASIAPGMFNAPIAGAKKLLGTMKTIGSGSISGKIAANIINVKSAFSTAGGGLKGLKSAAGTLARMAPMALRIMGPVGIIAGGLLLFKNINDELTKAAKAQDELGKAAEGWANVLGYEFQPGTLPGQDDKTNETYASRVKLVNEMKKANEELAPALQQAAKSGQAYEAAMQQALQAITTGASPEQARQVFAASLQMAMVKPFEIEQLLLKFDKVDLTDPEGVRSAIATQMQGIYDNVGDSITYDSSQGKHWWDDVVIGVREFMGGDLSEAMKAAGKRGGQNLMTGIQAAGDDKQALGAVFDNLMDQTNKQFDDWMKNLQKDPKLKNFMKKYGIETADQLNDIYETMNSKKPSKRNPMETELAAIAVQGSKTGNALENFSASYSELLDNIVTGIGQVMHLSDAEIDELRGRISSIMDIKTGEYGLPKAFISSGEAMKQYSDAVSRGASSWSKYSDTEKLAILNTYRAKAGLKNATSWTQGFKDSVDDASTSTSWFGSTLNRLTGALANVGKMNVTGEDLSGASQNAMSGAWKDLMSEAESRYDAQRKAVEDGIQAAGDLRQKGYDTEEKNQKAHFDQLEKDQDAYWDGIEKGGEKAWEQATRDAENYWDTLEKATDDAAEAEDKAFEARKEALEQEREDVEKAYDARIEAVQATIDAEEAAEEQRQKIFEAEQTRISRMAQRLNDGISFQMALNSGDMDEAAKLANDASARDQQWSNEDANANLSSISEKHRSDLESQIKVLQAEKEAKDTALQEEIDRVNAEQEVHQELHKQRMDEIKEQRDAALQALKDQEEADKENVARNREADEERLKSSRQSSEEDLANRRQKDLDETASSLQKEQKKTEIDKAGLTERLRALQEFIPQNEGELRSHIGRVEAVYSDYGLNLTQQGSGWANVIGEKLKTNVDVAAAALQTQINWRQIAENIASQVGAGMGMSLAQVGDFLRTGKWPAGAAPVAPAYVPGSAEGAAKNAIQSFAGIFRHSGGQVDAGGSFSQADRVGVQRSAQLMPSEIPTVLKSGEYVVKAGQARKHLPTLDAINNGRNPQANDIGGPNVGGVLAEMIAGYAALNMMAPLMVAGMVARKKMDEGYATYQASMLGSGSIDEGGGAIYQRLFSTVKRQFPRANLNSGVRPGDPGYHGKGMAVDLGEQGFAGGAGRPYLADMNRWIYDTFPMATELIYNGNGDDRPNRKDGRDFAYSAAVQAQHRNHVHWAMTQAAISQANARGLTGPSALAGGIAYSGAAGVEQWRGTVMQALSMLGLPAGWAGNTLRRMNQESGGNPRAINNWDSNAAKGIPSKGLMQVIDPTFRANYDPRTPNDIWNPLSNIVASMKYAMKRYGSLPAAYDRKGGYDSGGWLQPGKTLVDNSSGKPEPVFSAGQWEVLKANIGTQTYDIPMSNNAMPVRLVDSSVATGQQNVYDIDIEFSGPVNTDIDVKRAVWEAIDERESRNGRRRVIK